VQLYFSRGWDVLASNRAQLWYWMLMTRAYWRLEEVFGFNMCDWAMGGRW